MSDKEDLQNIKCQSCPTLAKGAFKNLNSEELAALCKSRHLTPIDKGELIMREGAYAKGVYCVQSGHFKLTAQGGGGRETIVRFASSGDLIGYRALLADDPLSVSVAAVKDATACFVPKDILLSFLKSNGPFSLELLRQTSHELSETNKLLASLAQKKVRERLAEVLLMLHAKFGKDEEGCINIDLKRQELAELVGAASESLIRLLSQFEKDGIIRRAGKRFEILDHKQLLYVSTILD
jgi:CRP-like cAMP-binding protein